MGNEEKGRGSSRNRPKVKVVTKKGSLTLRDVPGVARTKYAAEREEDLSEMVSMVLNGKSY